MTNIIGKCHICKGIIWEADKCEQQSTFSMTKGCYLPAHYHCHVKPKKNVFGCGREFKEHQ